MTPTAARTCPTTARTPRKFPSKETDPASRNGWGVDLNRNFSQGSIFDGFFGATFTDCTNGNFAGIFEFSEPETRNESWVQTTFRNIKFINNIHSSGGFFMWPPGAYTAAAASPLPYPPYGTLNFFDQTGKEVLDRIKSHRAHGDPAAADRPGHRRPVLRGRQQRRRGVLQQRHHRLRLRDRGPALQRHRARGMRPATRVSSRRSGRTRRTRACSTRASTRRWSSRPATTGC